MEWKDVRIIMGRTIDTAVLRNNIIIMKEAWKAVGKKKDEFYKVIGFNRTYNDILMGSNTEDTMYESMNRFFDAWNIEEISNKIGLNPDVLTGDYVIEINTESIQYLRNNFEELISSADASEDAKKKLMKKKDSVINEFNLWDYIIWYKITNKSENDAFQQSFNLLKKEIRNQVKNDNIQDEQLRIFVNYIKQL